MDAGAVLMFSSALSAFCLAIACLAVGLWWGERGRRMDAQRREGVIAVDPTAPAKVIPPGGAMPETPDGSDIDVARERYVEKAMREGYGRKEAEEDWDRMMERVYTDEPPEPW